MSSQTFSLEKLDTPTGWMLVVTDENECLRALDWQDHEDRMMRLLGRHYGPGLRLRDIPGRTVPVRALEAYYAGDLEAIARLPIAHNGTDFQRAVWDELRRIPTGSTLSYAELAVNIGRPGAARAVGLANGSNPVAIVVPCHRVIGADSSITGYGGGIDRKRWLLAHERALGATMPLLS